MCFRSGPTRYYFFYGGTRHYYGTRTWSQCNGHCDQSVYLDQASWTMTAVGGTGFSGYDTPNQIKSAIAAQWIGVNQNLIQVNCASTTCNVQVMLPDGASKYQFQSTIQQGCLGGGSAYTSVGVNSGGTVSCSTVLLTRVAVQAESGVRPSLPPRGALSTFSSGLELTTCSAGAGGTAIDASARHGCARGALLICDGRKFGGVQSNHCYKHGTTTHPAPLPERFWGHTRAKPASCRHRQPRS